MRKKKTTKYNNILNIIKFGICTVRTLLSLIASITVHETHVRTNRPTTLLEGYAREALPNGEKRSKPMLVVGDLGGRFSLAPFTQ